MNVVLPWLFLKASTACYAHRVAKRKGLHLRAFSAHCWLLSETTLPAVLVLPPAPDASQRYVRQAVGEQLYYTPAILLIVALAVAALTFFLDHSTDLRRLPEAVGVAYVVVCLGTAFRCAVTHVRLEVQALYAAWLQRRRLTSADQAVLRALWEKTAWPAHVTAELRYEGRDGAGPHSARLVMMTGARTGVQLNLVPVRGGFEAEVRSLDNTLLRGYSAKSLDEVVAAASAHPEMLRVLTLPATA